MLIWILNFQLFFKLKIRGIYFLTLRFKSLKGDYTEKIGPFHWKLFEWLIFGYSKFEIFPTLSPFFQISLDSRDIRFSDLSSVDPNHGIETKIKKSYWNVFELQVMFILINNNNNNKNWTHSVKLDFRRS